MMLVLQARSAAGSAGGSWTGAASSAAADRQQSALGGLTDLAARLGSTAAVVRALAERMEASVQLVRQAERTASDRGARTDEDGNVVVSLRSSSGDPVLDAHLARRDDEMRIEVRRCVAEAERVARCTDADAHRRLLGAASGALPSADLGGLVVVPPPFVGRDPVSGAFASAAWWRSLTPAERREVLSSHPEWAGPRDGVPARDRHTANLVLLARARASVAAELREAGRGSDSGALLRARERAASIEAISDVLGRHDGVTRHLLLVDLAGPVVRAVTTVGDVDRVGHVATFVGGLSTRPDLDLRRYDERFAAMRTLAWTKTVQPGAAGDVAVVLWMGYPAPQWRDGVFGARSVLRRDVSRDYADDLAAFTNGVAASRDAPVHQTLWAHSYGTVLAGLALKQLMRIDDVALFGSPGTELTSLAQAGLKAGSLNVLAAATDPVAMSGWHVLDPRDIPGASILSTFCAVKPGSVNDPLTSSIGHSEYLEAGSTSEENLTAIAAGRPDARIFPGGACATSDDSPIPGL